MSKIIDRFDKYMKVKGLNDNRVTEDLSLSVGLIGKSRKEGRDLSRKVIDQILNFYTDIEKTYLLSGDGPMLKESPESSATNAREKNVTTFMNIPLVPVRGKAGYLTGFGDMEYIESLPTIPVIVDKEYKGKYRCFEVDGDSMDDDTRNAICDRDIVLGREIKRELWKCKLHIRDWNFIIVHKDGISIKSIVEHDVENGVIKCHSKNPFYEDYYLKLDEVIELYNLIKIVDRNVRN